MVRASKWIMNVEPGQPLSKVAKIAIHERLKTVWYFANLAARKSHEDLEHVHQLRVATRRARAALQLFGDLLRKREARWLKKHLRELRQVAGNARDLDVLGERLGNLNQKKFPHLKAIVKEIAKQRKKAQIPLIKGVKKANRLQFPQRSRAVAKAVQWRNDQSEPSYVEAARSRLRPLVFKFFETLRSDLSKIDQIHKLRISGKQIRYAMELVAGAFDESFRTKLYPPFEELQDELGEINDHATAIVVFRDWREKTDDHETKAELASLVTNEKRQLKKKHQKFLESWTDDRKDHLMQLFCKHLEIASV